MTSRNQIMNALLGVIAASSEFKTAARRNRAPESFKPADTPALILVQHSQNFERQSSATPPKRTMTVDAIIYVDVGTDENAIPSTFINDALDALEVAMQPDSFSTGRFTLGGLVQSAMISGDITEAPGDITGKGIAVIPIDILLP